MSEHTPGPWVAIEHHHRWHGDPPIFRNGLWHIVREWNVELLPIATVDRANDHHEPTRLSAEVDARLIAAAPDLLEACRLVWAEASDRITPHRTVTLSKALEAVAAAIAKVNG